MAGILITLEGVDGSGKSTQTILLEQYAKQKGKKVIVTQEPGGTRIGIKIRELLLDCKNSEMTALTEVFLYAAARAQHIEEVIRPALRQNCIVICSRFIDSTLAYQGYGGGLSLSLLENINLATSEGIEPKLTILFDVDPKQGLKRVTERETIASGREDNGDRMERKEVAFHERVREGFLAIARSHPHRIQVVDGSLPIEKAFEKVKDLVDPLLLQ